MKLAPKGQKDWIIKTVFMIRNIILNIFISAAVMICAVPAAQAFTYFWGSHPNHERIVFEFPGQLPDFDVNRTGTSELTLFLSEKIPEPETSPPRVDFAGSRLMSNVLVQERSCIIKTKTNAFGYISFALPHENKVVIDIFQDPLGAKWRPEAEIPVTTPPEPPPEPQTDPLPEPPVEEEPEIVDQTVPDPAPVHQIRASVQRTSPEHSVVIEEAETIDQPPSSRITAKIKRDEVSEPAPEPAPEPREFEFEDAALTGQEEVMHHDLEETAEFRDEYQEKIFAAMVMFSGGDFRNAANRMAGLIDDPELPDQYLEELLYTYADANFQMLRHDIRNNFYSIVAPFERAINYDPGSERLPNALLNLGYIHLQVGNEPEARGHFNLIRERFPHHASVPSTYFYWGDYYMRQKMFQEAADNFEHIVENYPDDQLVKPAAVNLARAFSELDFHRLALDVLEYVQNRWPRHYIDEPDFLTLGGYILYSNDQLDESRDRFLHYINLVPEGDEVDVSMARIGDIYLLQDKKDAAREMYEETIRKYPDEEGGLIAAMRLAEEGIYDEPSISDMFTVFDQPFTLRPKQIYTRISEEYPDSPLAPVALLKLAIWELFQNNFHESLEAIDRFHERYTHKELWPRALELGFEAFAHLTQDRFKEDDFEGIIDPWEFFEYLNQNPDMLDSESALALATSYWNMDRLNEALSLARPFMKPDRINEYGQAALSLVLGIYLEMRDWEKILELVKAVQDWDLPQDKKMQVDYARALALQNRDRKDEALPIWRKLAVETAFPGEQRAFALFFLAQDAFRNLDYEKVYVFAQESLALFMFQEEKNLPRIITNLDMLIEATSRTGRTREALGWALEYENYIEEDSHEWPAIQYRLARMYRLNHQYENWERVLTELVEAYPDDVFSRMARSDLNTRRLATEAEQYRP